MKYVANCAKKFRTRDTWGTLFVLGHINYLDLKEIVVLGWILLGELLGGIILGEVLGGILLEEVLGQIR